MKHIRKIIVAILAIAVVATTAIVPAMAEGNIPQMNNGMTVTGRGGMGGRGGFGGQQGRGQMPQDNNQQPQDGSCQQMPGRMGKGFKGGRGHRDMMNLDALVQNGTLSQETRDAIAKYMTEKKQAEQEDRMKSLLDELKDAGVITQEDCDAIEAAGTQQSADATAEAPEAPAEAPEAPADAPDAPADAPEAPEAPAEQAVTQE